MRFFSDFFHDTAPRREEPVACCCDMADLFVGTGWFLRVVKTNSIDWSAVIHDWRGIELRYLRANTAHQENAENRRAADRR